MKKLNLFLILLSFFRSMSGQQHQRPTQEQLVRETYEQLPLIRAELGNPVMPDAQRGQAVAVAPNQQNIELYKQRLQGAAFGRLSTAMLAGQERLHVQRIAQEAIAQVAFTTAAAQEAALQERFMQKNANLEQARSNCQEAEDHLGTLQEIKQMQDQQKQKAAEHETACKDLEFLKEKKALDDQLHKLNNDLSRLDMQMTSEIMAVQEMLRRLKHS